MTYDSAGNTIQDPITCGGARTYDADNRMISAQSGATWNYYFYDADGKRVRRIVAGTETWQVYGFSREFLSTQKKTKGSFAAFYQRAGCSRSQLLRKSFPKQNRPSGQKLSAWPVLFWIRRLHISEPFGMDFALCDELGEVPDCELFIM